MPAPGAGAPAPATAQAAPAAAPMNPGVVPGVSPSSAPPPEGKSDIHQPFVRSLFFTNEELVQIRRAADGKAPVSGTGSLSGGGQIIPQVRTITLTGVLYKNPNEWLIWLNGQKLNPGNLLKEIIDIRVERDMVHLKWFDIGLNGIIDVSLRPHQKYDIVTGLMLPVPAE
ncbi:MAG TPA: hypothetical protein VEF76_11990 [Patescibacteria group bacterium]|nr:hypothetical protein [Patescibacteria group bacterium]